MPVDAAARRAAQYLREADALVICAGAGMGVDSGLPDFRGAEGFWRAYPALRDSGIVFEGIANPAAFVESPERAWGFYGHRLALYRRTEPHAGFAILKAWGERMAKGCFVFTSNVDGQFQKAGFDPQRVHECHGSIHRLQCLGDCDVTPWDAGAFVPETDDASCRLLNAPPACPRCGGIARPNILMFGDWRWSDEHEAEQRWRLDEWLDTVSRLVVIELGAGRAIPSVRNFSRRMVEERGAKLVRINPRDYEVASDEDVSIAAGALAGLRAIEAALG